MNQRAAPRAAMSPYLLRSSAANRLAPSSLLTRIKVSKESILPSAMPASPSPTQKSGPVSSSSVPPSAQPIVCGMPLKYISLLTLAIQNAALSIVMHYSRISIPASKAYSPASAVLLNELLKGAISLAIAFARSPGLPPSSPGSRRPSVACASAPPAWSSKLRHVMSEVFSPDCYKLSIPAILYVIQNSLQFVAISNLPVASFQVAYQMKILTTAAFSVALLGKRLSKSKWLSLFFLAIGVGIVQIQTTAGSNVTSTHAVGSAAAAAPKHIHNMLPLRGFAAVTAACFTSGLAGVYFEMVLKGSQADLWVRNVQLSFFSLVPALLPIVCTSSPSNILSDLLKNFGFWAWATVAIQVFGGLVTAVVIKYSDNILKGFATSLSIILSFLASVWLFDFRITSGFLFGSSVVLSATLIYNQPASRDHGPIPLTSSNKDVPHVTLTPFTKNGPILGEAPPLSKTTSFGSSQSLSSFFGVCNPSDTDTERLAGDDSSMLMAKAPLGSTTGAQRFSLSPYPSRAPSPVSSEPSTPVTQYIPRGQW